MNLLAHGRKEGHFVVLNHGLNKTVILFLATWFEIFKKKKKQENASAMPVDEEFDWNINCFIKLN